MDTVKRLIMLQIPTSICNFRCHYCYLSHKEGAYQGKQAEMHYSPEHVAKALSKERLGGPCFINACAAGETLLTKDIDQYFKALVEEGHYLEIVTNMTVTPMIDRILSWDKELLKHIEFKCSFHYLELKKRNLLDLFAENVNKAWRAGASITVEITPSDELIPYIPEVKEFSLRNFGALPQITVARNNRTIDKEKLTGLSEEEYARVWSVFDSELWQFKNSIFGVKRTEFCYAGDWSLTVDLATGNAKACYYKHIGNVFSNPDEPLPLQAMGECPIAHCFNGHAFLTFGLVPGYTDVKYSDMRNRVRQDGTEWLYPELKAFFSTNLLESNQEWSASKKRGYIKSLQPRKTLRGRLSEYRFYQKLHDWKEKLK